MNAIGCQPCREGRHGDCVRLLAECVCWRRGQCAEPVLARIEQWGRAEPSIVWGWWDIERAEEGQAVGTQRDSERLAAENYEHYIKFGG